MKSCYFLAIFLIVIYVNSVISLDKIKKKIDTIPAKALFEGYFYLQRLYPGVSSTDNLKFSSNTPKLKYFTLNEKFLYFSKSAEDKTKIQGGLKLKRILDKKTDKTSEGKCCTNIKYKDFTPKFTQNPQKAPLFTQKNKEHGHSFTNANFCLDLFAPFKARWRLCGYRPIDAYRLQLKIVYFLIKSTVNLKTGKAPAIIEKFLTNSKLAPESIDTNWNWETQKKWGGKCSSNFMQSPIKIIEGSVSTAQVEELKIKYMLLNTHVEVVRRYNEIVIQFKNDPGLLLIELGTKRLIYRPKYISFRFPGEHNILGKRYSGDMLINCEEVSEQVLLKLILENKNYKWFDIDYPP